MRELAIVLIAITTLIFIVLGIRETIIEISVNDWSPLSQHYTSLTLYGFILMGILYKRKE